MSVTFAVSSWSGWCHSDDEQPLAETAHIQHSAAPDVSVIPPMLRRRLNQLGRACASEVLRHIGDQPQTPVVYCSQHGDIERTLNVLSELVDGEPVSPMHFSLAVHNAICGVLSIQVGNKANISALAAGENGLVPVLLEAAGILQEGAERVICVLCDVVLPDVYRDAQSKPDRAYALCFEMVPDGATELSLQMDKDTGQTGMLAAPLDFARFLDGGDRQCRIEHNGRYWSLQKTAG